MGREVLLDRLVARLTNGDASVSTGGTGGAGKTTLAVKLAHDPRILAHFTEGVLWAALGKDPTIEAILADWAGALGLDVSGMAEPADRAKAIKNAIGARRILLLIDDVWDESAANVLRCGGPNCAHLLTTRDDGIARAFAGAAATEKVPELEPDPAFELLQRLAPEVCATDPDAARALVRDVGGLPLAIELLGGYLGDPEHTGLSVLRNDALREMSEPARRLKLARERLGGRAGERLTLERTIELSLEDLPEEVVQAFYCLGAFAPKPDSFDPETAQVTADTDESFFGLLLKRNLLELPKYERSEGERISIHPVIAEYARSRMDTEAVTRHRAAYEALLDSNAQDWRMIEREYAQIRHAWSQIGEDALGKIAFVYRVQDYQRLCGLWNDQITWTKNALELAIHMHLKGDVATLLSNLGMTHSALGQRQKALEYYERSLPIREEVGDLHGLAATLNNIGGFYNAQEQWQKAMEYYERALSIFEEVDDREGLVIALNNIGTVHSAQGQQQKALEYFERAFPIVEEVGDREGLAETLNNFGAISVAQGQVQKALEYFERALPIREEVGDRRGLAVTLNSIGRVYAALEQWQRALEYYERALLIREEVGDRRGLAVTINNIGTVYAAHGQRQKALEYYERALPIREEVADRTGEAVTRFSIGIIYRREGRLTEAVEQFRRSVALDEAVQRPELEQDRAVLREVEAELAAQAETVAPPSLFYRLKLLFRRKD